MDPRDDGARSRAYPSPPRSGSQPLPPADSSGHGNYGLSSGQEVFWGTQAPQFGPPQFSVPQFVSPWQQTRPPQQQQRPFPFYSSLPPQRPPPNRRGLWETTPDRPAGSNAMFQNEGSSEVVKKPNKVRPIGRPKFRDFRPKSRKTGCRTCRVCQVSALLFNSTSGTLIYSEGSPCEM